MSFASGPEERASIKQDEFDELMKRVAVRDAASVTTEHGPLVTELQDAVDIHGAVEFSAACAIAERHEAGWQTERTTLYAQIAALQGAQGDAARLHDEELEQCEHERQALLARLSAAEGERDAAVGQVQVLTDGIGTLLKDTREHPAPAWIDRRLVDILHPSPPAALPVATENDPNAEIMDVDQAT